MSELEVQAGDLSDPRVRRLLDEHLADMYATSPAESVHALDVSGLRDPSVTFWVLVDGDQLLGCVALKQIASDHGELKSMRTAATARGRGFGRLLLEHVLAEARARGYRRVSLETGAEGFFLPARTLYSSYGFTVTDPFAEYTPDPHSVFMTLEL